MNLSKEQIAVIVTQVVALIVYVLKGPLPDAWQPFVPYVIGVVEAVGALIVYLFGEGTKREVAALKADIKRLSR